MMEEYSSLRAASGGNIPKNPAKQRAMATWKSE